MLTTGIFMTREFFLSSMFPLLKIHDTDFKKKNYSMDSVRRLV